MGWGDGGVSFLDKVKEDPAVEEKEEAPVLSTDGSLVRVVVLDSNAIFKGLKVRHLAERAVTVPEVFKELKDSAGRANATDLTLMPLDGLQVMEPSEESLRAVKKFAAMTGDLPSLAGTDLKLIALAYTLEEKSVGVAHLRTQPPQRTALARQSKAAAVKALPGWGNVANPEEWAELDDDADVTNTAADVSAAVASPSKYAVGRLPGLDRALGGGEGGSRIVQSVLDLGTAAAMEGMQEGADGGGGEAEGAASVADHAMEEQEEQDDGGWEKTRSRRVNRKHKRREIMVAEAEEEATRGGGCASAAAGGAEADGGDAGQPGPSASAETTDTTMGGAEGERTDGGEEGEDGESGNNNKFDMAAHSVESHVSIITSDFAMQNVILQMGLRLLTPDGVRIDSLQRFALRCEACFNISLASAKAFCARCGNGGTMKKVTMQVDANGVVQFGVRKRHNIRGTRYSLPQPKGGREAKNPILREDQLIKMGASRKAKVKTEEDFSMFEGAAAHYLLKEGSQFDITDRRNPNQRRSNSNRKK